MPVTLLVIEIAAIWVIYYLLNLVTATSPPLWALAIVLIAVDKAVDAIRSRTERPRPDQRCPACGK